ncbi:MAG: Rieske 2Fe-2S domain-containing protein, partial [Chloroflexota bacterium]|nr:Rieske 2Fe-2S domain-containing protein [Chloroflexota bacterium]
MLSREDNELITRVGPGTPMGNLMRQYWLPFALSSEVKADDDPVRIMLLGEQLIAFRDSQGQVGLIQNACPHRGASLFFGRNEECGLRCVYHGWKFDVEGNCTDMPNEPAESSFKNKVRATAYPCLERAGMVWTYMGSRQPAPQMPDFEGLSLPEDDYRVSVFQRECNWLQAVEGDIDTCHIGFLHGGHRRLEDAKPETFSYYALKDRAPKYAVVDTDWGTMYGAYRDANPGYEYWRIAHFFMPFYSMPPQNVLGLPSGPRAWVPMDDTHTLVFSVGVKGSQNWSLNTRPQANPDNVLGSGSGLLPNTTDWFGRFRIVA